MVPYLVKPSPHDLRRVLGQVASLPRLGVVVLVTRRRVALVGLIVVEAVLGVRGWVAVCRAMLGASVMCRPFDSAVAIGRWREIHAILSGRAHLHVLCIGILRVAQVLPSIVRSAGVIWWRCHATTPATLHSSGVWSIIHLG